MKEKDLFENKSVLSAVLSMALPSIVGQIILVIYNIADTLFVGLTENAILINAVTICMPAYMILTAISNLFGVGGSSVISRSLGKGKPDRAKRASSFAFWGCLSLSLIYCGVVALFAPQIADMLGAHGDQETIAHAALYLRIAVAAFGVPTAINSLFSHLIRSQGFGFHASFGIGLGGILNVLLDPLFIFVICGVENAALGAAIATGLSNFIALLYYVFLFIFGKKVSVNLMPRKSIFSEGLPKEILLVGLPACLMTLFENISYAILGNQMGSLSPEALTGVEVAKKVNMFAHNAVRGMAQGVLPLIGYNKSSGNRKRMKQVVLVSGAISLGIALVAATINAIPFSGRALISLFLHGEVANLEARQQFGYWFLLLFSIGAPFSAIAYTVISFFQAVGKAWRSLILALLRKGILDIPLMFILQAVAASDFKPYSIVMATPIADALCCAVAIFLFAHYISRHGQNKPAKQSASIEPSVQ